MELPKLQSLWQHTNGNFYEVLLVTNIQTERPEKYPVTVVYCNARDFSIWSRPLSAWHRSMTEVKESSFTRHTDLKLPVRSALTL